MEFPTQTAALQKKENIMKRIHIVLAAATLLVFAAGSAMAASITDAKTVILSATMPSKAALTLTNTGVTFDGTSIDSGTPIVATAIVGVTAKVRTSSAAKPTLTANAGADFVGATATIPVADVSWTGSGDLLAAGGNLAVGTEKTVNDVWTGSKTYTGNMTFKLLNPVTPAYQADTYSSVTVAYTLTAP